MRWPFVVTTAPSVVSTASSVVSTASFAERESEASLQRNLLYKFFDTVRRGSELISDFPSLRKSFLTTEL